MRRNECCWMSCLRRLAADNNARWIVGTAVYQVGRKSVSQPKKAAGSNPWVQTTLDPAANAASSPENRPCAWNRGRTFSNRSCDPSANVAPTLWADRQTLACVSGTIFGRDVLPEVNKIKAWSAPPAANPLLTARDGTEPTRLNAPAPSSGRGDRSMTGMPRVCAAPRLAVSMSARVNRAATRKSAR